MKIRTGLLAVIFLSLVVGCSSLPAIISGASLASNVLPIVESFYGKVLEAKDTPDKLQAATLILQQADSIAAQVKSAAEMTAADEAKLKAQAQVLEAQAAKL